MFVINLDGRINELIESRICEFEYFSFNTYVNCCMNYLNDIIYELINF